MAASKPFNLQAWIDQNRHLLKPPVGNFTLFKESENFIVMVVGGPNSRRDYHVNAGEELFYQLEGSIELKTIEDGKRITHVLNQGDMFLLPPFVPHSPRRPAGTVGLVIELIRTDADVPDGFRWYCEHCGNLMHEEQAFITDIVTQLPPVMARFTENKELRTCKKCGTYMELPSKA